MNNQQSNGTEQDEEERHRKRDRFYHLMLPYKD